jgi:hypothetical protein
MGLDADTLGVCSRQREETSVMMTAIRWAIAVLPAILAFWRVEVWIVDNCWEEETWPLLISVAAAVGAWVLANMLLANII